MHSALKIEVLYTKKCRRWPEIFKLLKQALEELSLPAEISTQEIRSRQEAYEKRFMGSPTILINGEDLEPGAKGAVHLA